MDLIHVLTSEWFTYILFLVLVIALQSSFYHLNDEKHLVSDLKNCMYVSTKY